MVRIEFTIEPFVEGQPGVHVQAAVAAAQELGAVVDFGPFASSCDVDVELAGPLTSAVTSAALANGATHVNVHVERLP